MQVLNVSSGRPVLSVEVAYLLLLKSPAFIFSGLCVHFFVLFFFWLVTFGVTVLKHAFIFNKEVGKF